MPVSNRVILAVRVLPQIGACLFAFAPAMAQEVRPLPADQDANAAPSGTNGNLSRSASEEIGEIVVTASRRSESVRKVPTAISAYSGSSLKEAQITSLTELASATPNLQISSYGTNANINIRGVGNGNLIQAGGEPGVAVSSDGVYLGQSSLAISTLLDVARVEILRGPQGTLFGRNATGGAINLIPNGPTPDLAYGFDLAAGVDPTDVHSSG